LREAPEELVKYLAAYAVTASHPFTAVDHTIADATQIATAAGRHSINLSDIKEAIKSFRTDSEMAKRQRFDDPGKGTKRKGVLIPLESGFNEPESPLQESGEEDTFTGPKPVAAVGRTPASISRATALQHA